MSATATTPRLDQVRVDEVIVGERARKDYGDLTDLMESIREHGVLQPIGLAPGNHLLFGGRRLEAARRLGMTVINVTRPSTQTDALSLLKAERDENTCRKDMTPEELVDLGLRIEEMERPAAEARKAEGNRLGGINRQAGPGPAGPQPEPEREEPRRTNDVVGEALGLSRNTYKRMKHVVKAARDEDEKSDVREVAKEALAKMNAGEMTPTAAERKVRESRNGEDARKKPRTTEAAESTLTRPQPPKFGGNRKKHAAVIDSIAISLTGLAMAADDITEFDNTVTQEEAVRLANDLSASIRSINRLKQALNRKATP